MKKTSILLLILSFITMTSISQSFQQLSFQSINNDSISVSSYLGKKTLFVVVPFNSTDSVYGQLQAFKNRYLDTVRIVGILSFEDGYQSANAAAIQNIYSSLGIILTNGMYTKKGSANQSSIMKWFTHKTQNIHYDMDSEGIGQKFFVNESGRLFAVLPPQANLNPNNRIIDKIVHSGAQ